MRRAFQDRTFKPPSNINDPFQVRVRAGLVARTSLTKCYHHGDVMLTLVPRVPWRSGA